MSASTELFLETYYKTKATIPFNSKWLCANGELSNPDSISLPVGFVARSTNVITGMKVLVIGTECGTFTVYLRGVVVVLAASPATVISACDLEMLLDGTEALAA
jgi:hypothetical protein